MDANHPLRRWRKSQGLTTQQAAELFGVSRAAILSYESGRREPKPAVRVRIREATGGAVTADDFLPAREDAEARP